MKKLALTLMAISIIWLLPVKAIDVNASVIRGSYMRVINHTTSFYRNPQDTTALFYLPYTYYVKVLNKDGDYLHVECYGNGNTPRIDGYVLEQDLYYDNLLVIEPYLNLSVTTLATTPLYSDSSLSNREQYIFKDRTLFYYGQFEHNGKVIYYVAYNDKLGYVEESYLYPFNISLHPNELTFITPDTTPSDKENLGQTDNFDKNISLKIAIISCLIFAGIIALSFLLKSSSEKPKLDEYYDQNEFE